LIDNNRYSIYELIAFSGAALYFELAVIRFTAAQVLYLGYFSNFILISSFVGLGLGFMSARKRTDFDNYLPFIMLFLFSLVLVSEFDVQILKNHFGLFFFGNIEGRAGLPGAMLLVILLLSTVAFFLCIGRRIALAFMKFKSLRAYTYDIIGSLLGITVFSLQSLAASSPDVWIITGGLFLLIGYLLSTEVNKTVKSVNVVLACTCIVILLNSAQSGLLTIWSAYQKLEVLEDRQSGSGIIYANGIKHQFMHPVSTADRYYYSYPYKLMKQHGLDYSNVLIIGAGAGTDVAVALKYGANNIDAVEIDSRILDIGKQFHPDRPYSDNRVNLYIADGRQFLKTSGKKYDLIIFALPDSLMRLSAMNSVRLESFLFTLEAFEDVKQHLADKGVFVMYNQYRWQWLVNKIATSLDTVFGKHPFIYTDGPTTLLATGAVISGSEISRDGFENLAVDDWPFVYMQKPGIHWLYIGMIAVFLIVSVGGVYFLAPAGTLRRPDYPFFFMGMAFLLLETKSLAFFSLLFGTTWVVNSLAFTGILISVLVANLLVQKFNIRVRLPLYLGLFACLALAYLVPPAVFLNIGSLLPRFLLGTVLMFLPIFFANLIFSREFKDVDESTRVFGWNLLGAVAGGGLEYLSLMIGFRNLLWIVAICYLCAAIFTRLQTVNVVHKEFA
jgi:spermidine synthase